MRLWTNGFRRLLATRLTSQLGDGVLTAGVTWLTLLAPDAQRTPGAFVAVLALLLLPFTTVGPFVGVILDRWPRQRIVVVGELVRAALVVAIAVLTLVSGERASVGLYALVLTGLGVNRLLLAAFSSAVPHVVSPEQLVDANAIAPTAGTLASATGVAIGAGAIALGASSAGVLAGAAMLFCLASVAAGGFARTALGPDTGTRAPRPSDAIADLVAALRHLRRRTVAAVALAKIGALRLVLGAWTLAAFSITAGRQDDRGAVLVAAATAAGYGAAAVTAPFAARRWGLRAWVPRLVGVVAVAFTAALLLDGVATFMVQGAALGLGGQTLKIQTDTLVQGAVDESYLGRSFSIYDVVFNAGTLLGALTWAVVVA